MGREHVPMHAMPGEILPWGSHSGLSWGWMCWRFLRLQNKGSQQRLHRLSSQGTLHAQVLHLHRIKQTLIDPAQLGGLSGGSEAFCLFRTLHERSSFLHV